MMSYSEVIQEFPREIQFPMMKVLDKLREELLDTVTKSDFKKLEDVVSLLGDKILELAESQKRTGQRMEELADAQKRTEQRVEELAVSQKKTEDTLREVVKRQDRMSKELGGLSGSFGYFLENEAIRFLPGVLKRERNIDIKIMDRRFIVYADGKDDEINIYGEGLENGRKVYVIGESKSQLGKKDIDRFQKLVKRVSQHLGSEVYPLIVTHSAHPSVEIYARKTMPELGIYKSYALK
ncbi:MAG: hypothetical protein R2941_15080 [Desulfobacterales bacterium]